MQRKNLQVLLENDVLPLEKGNVLLSFRTAREKGNMLLMNPKSLLSSPASQSEHSSSLPDTEIQTTTKILSLTVNSAGKPDFSLQQ